MEISVYWSMDVCKQFPKLSLSVGVINNVHVEKENEKIKKLKQKVYDEVRADYRLEELKNDPTVRAYRDFYWKLHIDPTKTRPSGEALLRRVLHGNELPTISTVVDAYNLESLKTIIPTSGFDSEKLSPPLDVRFAKKHEPFAGIGASEPIALIGKILVLADRNQILSIYPYRDADHTKITEKTKNVLIIAYGAPGIAEQQSEEAVETTLSYIKEVSGGETGTVKVFSSTHK